ncbi:MAG: CvpA family protein [Dehalococcoidia bacterium]|nr:CvpA family protein [Dehalococcoidia bacterium]
MQWLDFLILFILAVSLLWGFRTGVLEVLFLCVGIIVGWWVSGRYADDAGELVSFSAGADAFVSVLAYIFIMSACTLIFVMVGRVIKTVANAGTLGASGIADRMSGVALGLVIGLTASLALIVVLARLAFAFSLAGADLDIPATGVAAVDSLDTATVVEDKKHILVDGLVNSMAVSLFLDLWGSVPRTSLGPVVGDFAIGLDLLAEEAHGKNVA